MCEFYLHRSLRRSGKRHNAGVAACAFYAIRSALKAFRPQAWPSLAQRETRKPRRQLGLFRLAWLDLELLGVAWLGCAGWAALLAAWLAARLARWLADWLAHDALPGAEGEG